MEQVTIIDGIEVFDIPASRAMAIAKEYGASMSNQKIGALLAASTSMTATELEFLPASTYAKLCMEVVRRLNARMAAAGR